MCAPDWLCWAGWTGVSGIVVLIALIAAIAIGLAQVFWSLPDASFVYIVVTRSEPDKAGQQDVHVTAEACGPRILYEVDATLVVHGEEETAVGATAPVLGVRDSPLVYDFKVSAVRLSEYRLIVEWIEGGPRERHGGVRLGLMPGDQRFEAWFPYGWLFAGRGRWKDVPRPKPGSPVGVDRTPVPPA